NSGRSRAPARAPRGARPSRAPKKGPSMSNNRPRVKLQPGGDKRAMLGHPWIFSNELVMDADAKALEPGTVVTVMRADGRALGAAFFNPHSLIAARLLTRDADRAIDETFLHRRLERAFKLRERVIGGPFYRLG